MLTMARGGFHTHRVAFVSNRADDHHVLVWIMELHAE